MRAEFGAELESCVSVWRAGAVACKWYVWCEILRIGTLRVAVAFSNVVRHSALQQAHLAALLEPPMLRKLRKELLGTPDLELVELYSGHVLTKMQTTKTFA